MNLEALHSEQEQAFLTAFDIPFPYVPPTPRFAEIVDPRKILVLADPHEPYAAQFVYDHALEHHHDAGMVVIPGDLGDYYSKSRFRKTKPGKFHEEVSTVFHRMEWLSQHFPDVRIMLGNHDNRPQKKIQDLLAVDPELLILTEAKLLDHMAAYFPNIDVMKHTIANTGKSITYIWQFGDIVFTHAEVSRLHPNATLDYVSSWLHRWRHVIKLHDYRVIVQAHNHQSDKRDVDGETWICVPTCSDIYSVGMEYAMEKMYRNPPVTGYAVLYHDDGVCDINASHNIKLER